MDELNSQEQRFLEAFKSGSHSRNTRIKSLRRQRRERIIKSSYGVLLVVLIAYYVWLIPTHLHLIKLAQELPTILQLGNQLPELPDFTETYEWAQWLLDNSALFYVIPLLVVILLICTLRYSYRRILKW